MDAITIREILDTIVRGQIRIPAFQRGFVWEPDRVAYLMDSIYKGYPFGSLLFWRTREVLRAERNLGPFHLPDPREDYPVDYVLDGQQRITSIFGVFQTELPLDNPESWQHIYFDFRADPDAQESQFFALRPAEVDRDRFFPLNTLAQTTAYRRATSGFSDDVAKRIDEMQSVFKEVRIPLQVFKTEEKATVAIIFERVNRQGVPLDTLQLLSAWTWSEEFQLQEQFGDLADQLGPFGFGDVGDDTNLLLRCCAAILRGDASPDALMNITGTTVRDRFAEVVSGVKGAVDYLRGRTLTCIRSTSFRSQLLLYRCRSSLQQMVIEKVGYSDEQRRIINRWFWRSAFAKRYSSGVLRNLRTDIEEMMKLRRGETSDLGNFNVSVTPDFFTENIFGMGNVNTKTFILLLAQARPLSFISAAPIDLADKLRRSNRAEFHHLMPRSFLKQSRHTRFCR